MLTDSQRSPYALGGRLSPFKCSVLIVISFFVSAIVAAVLLTIIRVGEVLIDGLLLVKDVDSTSAEFEAWLERNDVFYVLVMLFWVFICIAVLRRKWKVPWQSIGISRQNLLAGGAAGAIVGITAGLILPVVYVGILYALKILIGQPFFLFCCEKITLEAQSISRIGMHLVAVASTFLIGPFTEEILFRGIFYSSLRSRWGVHASVIVSSLIFASWHFHVYLGPLFFLWGVIAALLFERYRSIVAAISCHVAANGVAIVAGFLFL